LRIIELFISTQQNVIHKFVISANAILILLSAVTSCILADDSNKFKREQRLPNGHYGIKFGIEV